MGRLKVSDNMSSKGFSSMGDGRVGTAMIKHRVLGKLVDRVVDLYRLKWLGYVLPMPDHHLPRRTVI